MRGDFVEFLVNEDLKSEDEYFDQFETLGKVSIIREILSLYLSL